MHMIGLKHIFQWYFSSVENWQCSVWLVIVNNSILKYVLRKGFVISYIRLLVVFRNFYLFVSLYSESQLDVSVIRGYKKKSMTFYIIDFFQYYHVLYQSFIERRNSSFDEVRSRRSLRNSIASTEFISAR